MRAGIIVTGVLGVGSAAVFGLAAVAATMFPQGATVSAMWNGGFNSGVGIAQPAPVMISGPAPVSIGGTVTGGGSSGGGPASVAPVLSPSPPDATSAPTPSDTPPAK